MIPVLARLGFELTARNFLLASQNHLVQWAMVKQGLGSA